MAEQTKNSPPQPQEKAPFDERFIGVPFEPPCERLPNAPKNQHTTRDYSQYGIPFEPKPTENEDGTVKTPTSPPARDDSQIGIPFEPPRPDNCEGIPCPGCGCRHFTRVKESRPVKDTIQRSRKCMNCGQLIVTVEREKIADSTERKKEK